MKARLPPALAAATLWLAGCVTIPPPAVRLVDVEFGEATLLETSIRFTLRLVNETPEALAVQGAVHKIYLNGLFVGEGLSDEAVTVPRLGTATQTVTVHLSHLLLATRIRPLIESKRFDYLIASEL